MGGTEPRQQIYVFDTFVTSLIESVTAGAHKHGAYQLSISLDGVPHHVGPSPSELRSGLIHLVDTNCVHVLDGRPGRQVLVWIAPESDLGQSLRSAFLGDGRFAAPPDSLADELPLDALMTTLDERSPAEVAAPAIDALMQALSGWSSPEEHSMHPSIRRAVGIIRERRASTISADELAREVGLSTSRFLHLFKEQMGTPLRPYLQWLRIWDAFVAILRGRSATMAAAEAGFADAPHFNRVVQQYFGFAPLDVVRRSDLQVELCLVEPS